MLGVVQPARLELLLLDPQLRRHLGLVAPHLLDEPLGVLAPDEHLELDAEREVGREGVVDDGVDDHADTMTRSSPGDKLADLLAANTIERTTSSAGSSTNTEPRREHCFETPQAIPTSAPWEVTREARASKGA